MLNSTNQQTLPNQFSEESVCPFSIAAPRATNIKETGLSESLLLELLAKHLLANGVLTREQLVKLLGISGGVVQYLLESAKSLAWVENRQSTSDDQMRFALNRAGEVFARQALARSGYVGLAPVPLEQYLPICHSQSSLSNTVTYDTLTRAYSDIILPSNVIFQIGPALNSSRPILIYGAAGTGKSYICRHLNRLFGDTVLIPYAIAIKNEIIQIFDAELHEKVDELESENQLQLTKGHDPRWLKCRRPLRITGGELTADMLEVKYDPQSKTYTAPLQLKANNGILLIDDLGRQKISPKQLFNRWIIPMEERRDFLALPSGEHFEIPFALILIFSTNLKPKELVDEAFLRRLGYKIEFEPMAEPLYRSIWFEVCSELKLKCSNQVYQHLIEHYHQREGRPLLPCYPRDLLGIISDKIKFMTLDPFVTEEMIEAAWSTYFVK